MPRVRLQSRTLASVLYDAGQRQLELEFRSGKRYLYFQVPPPCYQELLRAESKGAYFNSTIRNRFAYRDLSVPSAPIVLALKSN